MHKRLMGLAVAVALACAPPAAAATRPPPPPRAASGHEVTVVGRGVPTPTAFAFIGGQLFVGGYGDESVANSVGGVYTLRNGKAVRVPGSPTHVYGLAQMGGTLYLSAGKQILAWSGWNGTRFARSSVVATGPEDFTGFNGIVAVPGGRLYAGVSLGFAKDADFAHGTTPFANDVLSVDVETGALAVVATGLRQPWQLALVPGHTAPLVSELGQEDLGKGVPPDRIVEVRQGADFGFPECPAKPAECARFTKPFHLFAAHASPMGLAPLGKKLYVALFGGTGKGPMVVSLPVTGGKPTPVLTGFSASPVALAARAGVLYVGELTGAIYMVKP